MIDPADLAAVDREYFDIIGSSDYYITLRSRSTRHEWHLLERIANGHRIFVISHRHRASEPYHLQRNKPTIEACCEYIKDHDVYQLKKEIRREQKRKGNRRRHFESKVRFPVNDEIQFYRRLEKYAEKIMTI